MKGILKVLKSIFGLDHSQGHTFYGRVLDSGSVVVDLGAYQGDFSKYVTTRYGCRACAVEAFPALFAKIDETSLVRKYNYAIAASDGVSIFHESSNGEAGNIIGPKPNSTGNTVEVEARKLSSFFAETGLREIDLLKVDIEGAEVQLFDNVREEDICLVKQITMEFHDSVPIPNVSTKDVRRIIEKIESMGFRGMAMHNKNIDWWFVNEKKLHLPMQTKVYLFLTQLIRRFA